MTDYSLNATVVDREDLTPDLAIFRIAPKDGAVPLFEPGQYAELAIPPATPATAEPAHAERVIRRSYSIASAPSERRHLEFYVVLVQDGVLTPKLWPLQVGDKLWLGPKIKGKFTLADIPPAQDLVMISTGTGIAPFVSMIREYGSARNGNARWRKLIIIHGARFSQDLGYREELEAYALSQPDRVKYIPLLTREPDDSSWKGLRGRVQTVLEPTCYEQLIGSPLRADTTQVMLCGNPEMIDAVQALLEGQGFRPHSKKNPGQIHFERYW